MNAFLIAELERTRDAAMPEQPIKVATDDTGTPDGLVVRAARWLERRLRR